MAGLNRELWIPEVLEDFYADDSFLKEARDMSNFVANNTINLASAGANPDVLYNNTTYPIPVTARTDSAIALALATFDTTNTPVLNIEQAELAYDKRASVMYGHKQALLMTFMERALHAYAPASNAADTPVLATSGDNDGSNFKKMTFEDLLDLETQFDEAEIPENGRILVLNTKHKNHLKAQDLKLYKEIFAEGKTFATFKLYHLASKRVPLFNKTTGAKVAFGATAAPSTDTISSVAFHKDEVMRCTGDVEIFHKEKLDNPEGRSDIFGLQMRGAALPIRGKGLGAIYSAAV